MKSCRDWSASSEISSGACQTTWRVHLLLGDQVCQPTKLGGTGIPYQSGRRQWDAFFSQAGMRVMVKYAARFILDKTAYDAQL